METRTCRKCGIEKPIGSFPKRYGKYTYHLREHICGMCKKRANAVRHPEKKKIETWSARARAKGIPIDEYIANRVRRILGRIVIKPVRSRKCPILRVNPKLDYIVNGDYYRAKSRDWGRRNPEKQLAKKQRRRARIAGCANSLTLDQWNEIKQRFRNRCAYCRKRVKKLTRDHAQALSAGGDDSPGNVVPACWSCNSSKGVGPPPVPTQTMLFA